MPLKPTLSVGQWPKDDNEWREAIAVIKSNLKGIMAICNKQAGPNPYDSMPYDEAVLFRYAHLAEYIRTGGNRSVLPRAITML